jgi:hypothetical protein
MRGETIFKNLFELCGSGALQLRPFTTDDTEGKQIPKKLCDLSELCG